MNLSVSPIESFIRKVRNAQINKSKDLKISIDEANEIIISFASLTSSASITQDLKQMKKSIENIEKILYDTGQEPMDGGTF